MAKHKKQISVFILTETGHAVKEKTTQQILDLLWREGYKRRKVTTFSGTIINRPERLVTIMGAGDAVVVVHADLSGFDAFFDRQTILDFWNRLKSERSATSWEIARQVIAAK